MMMCIPFSGESWVATSEGEIVFDIFFFLFFFLGVFRYFCQGFVFVGWVLALFGWTSCRPRVRVWWEGGKGRPSLGLV
jgi:hypothetical protein